MSETPLHWQSIAELSRRIHAGELSPVLLDLGASLEPVEAFRKLAGLPYVLFLDSAARDPRLGRHSYITAAPFEVLAAWENRLWRLESTGGPLSSTSYIPAGESQGDRSRADESS